MEQYISKEFPDGASVEAALLRAKSGGAIDKTLQKKVNPNLLDNGYFGNPVNQRNVGGTIDAVGYFLDRWKLVSGSVTIGSNGIALNGTIVQILETAVGTDVTASALTTEGVVVASYDNNSKTISLTGTGQTFVAAKLELGTHQTLAHQDENGNWVLNEIPDYGEQLRRCQRYYFEFEGNAAATRYQDQTHVMMLVPTPVTMRSTPVVTQKTANPTLLYFGDGYLDIVSTPNYQVYKVVSSGVQIMCDTGRSSGNQDCVVAVPRIALSSDL